MVRAARSDGVDGYLLTSISADEQIAAIERIFRGGPVFPQDKARTNAPARGRWPGDEHGLSGRESEVLALICQGLSNHEISQRAYIGIKIVKSYIRSAYRKIGVTAPGACRDLGPLLRLHKDTGIEFSPGHQASPISLCSS